MKWLSRRIAAPGPHLMLVLSQEEFDAALRKIRVPSAGTPWIANEQSDATTHYLRSPQGELACIIAIAGHEARDPVVVAGIIVHEAVHVWQQYAADIGEKNPGDEQEAYAIQSIAQELMAEFARRMA